MVNLSVTVNNLFSLFAHLCSSLYTSLVLPFLVFVFFLIIIFIYILCYSTKCTYLECMERCRHFGKSLDEPTIVSGERLRHCPNRSGETRSPDPPNTAASGVGMLRGHCKGQTECTGTQTGLAGWWTQSFRGLLDPSLLANSRWRDLR